MAMKIQIADFSYFAQRNLCLLLVYPLKKFISIWYIKKDIELLKTVVEIHTLDAGCSTVHVYTLHKNFYLFFIIKNPLGTQGKYCVTGFDFEGLNLKPIDRPWEIIAPKMLIAISDVHVQRNP